MKKIIKKYVNFKKYVKVQQVDAKKWCKNSKSLV